jgi:hypothetical protein
MQISTNLNNITQPTGGRPTRFVLRSRLGFLVTLIFLFAVICQAAPPSALIVWDGNGSNFLEATVIANLSTALTAAGYTVVQNVGLPGSIASYRQVWDVRYDNVVISGSETTQYVNYLAAGGSLVVLGENTSSSGTRDTSIASLVSSAGGGSISPVNAGNSQTVWPPFTTTPDAVTSISFSTPGGSASKGTGAFITTDGSNIGTGIFWAPGTLAPSKPGALIVVFDVDFINVAISGGGGDANSLALLHNLIGYENSPPPFIVSLTPNSGPTGTSVVIAGFNFGATQGASTVRFNGTLVTSGVSWGANSITANVPAGAATGNVTVTVNAVVSNGVLFTVTAAAVPTLSQGALILLACSLMAIAVWRVRRSYPPSAI